MKNLNRKSYLSIRKTKNKY